MWVASLTLARCEAWVVRLAEEASGCLKVKGFYEGIHGHVPVRCQGGRAVGTAHGNHYYRGVGVGWYMCVCLVRHTSLSGIGRVWGRLFNWN